MCCVGGCPACGVGCVVVRVLLWCPVLLFRSSGCGMSCVGPVFGCFRVPSVVVGCLFLLCWCCWGEIVCLLVHMFAFRLFLPVSLSSVTSLKVVYRFWGVWVCF